MSRSRPLSVAQAAVDAAAAVRLAQLAADDRVTDAARAHLADLAARDGALARVAVRVDYVLGCPACLGVWAGLAAVALDRVAPRLARALAASVVVAEVRSRR